MTKTSFFLLFRLVSPLLACLGWLFFAASLHAESQKRAVFLPFSIEVAKAPEHLQSGLANVLASRVAKRTGVQTLTQGANAERMRQALQNRDFSAFGRLLSESGADYLVLSTFGPSAAQYEVVSYVFTREGGAPRKLSRFLANSADPLAAVEDLANDVGAVIEGKSVPARRSSLAYATANPERAYRKEALAESVAGLEQESGFTLSESLRGQPIEMETLDLNSGDVDGDGRPELVLLAEKSLLIYRYEDSQFIKVVSLSLPRHLNYLAVSLADANANGVPELYIGASNRNLPSSSIWEWQNGKLVQLEENVPYYLHAFAPDNDALLLGQAPPPGETSGGAIALMRYEGGKLQPSGNVLPLPKGYNIYDVAPVDLDGDGKMEIVAIDRRNRLQVFKGGELAWTSADEYGASRNYYGTVTAVADSGKAPTYLHTRLAVADLDQDGLPEVVVGKNKALTVPYLTDIRYFDGSQIVGLKWEGMGMNVLWATRQIPGYTAGYQVLPEADTGRLQLFMAESNSPSIFQFWSSSKTTLHRLVLTRK